MDKLEMYLDRVCRGIAGPRSLRAHVRQELREHLKDAAAEHVAAGMGEAEALERAMEEFGGPEEVKAGLEATHGQRWLAVVMEQAMSWKEQTMKARWLWQTWAHLVVMAVLTGALVLVFGLLIFFVPKYNEFRKDDWLEVPGAEGVIRRCMGVLDWTWAVSDWWVWMLGGLVVVWGLFEWRARGENKGWMRVAGLGTLAVGVLGWGMVMVFAMLLPLMVVFPGASMGELSGERAAREVTRVQAGLAEMDRAATSKDWQEAAQQAREVRAALYRMKGGEAEVLEPTKVAVKEVKGRMREARDAAGEARDAAQQGDVSRYEAAVKRVKEAWAGK